MIRRFENNWDQSNEAGGVKISHDRESEGDRKCELGKGLIPDKHSNSFLLTPCLKLNRLPSNLNLPQ